MADRPEKVLELVTAANAAMLGLAEGTIVYAMLVRCDDPNLRAM